MLRAPLSTGMRSRPKMLDACWLMLAAVCAGAAAEDWPVFRGPHGTGVSTETGLLRAWPTNGPAVCWSITLNPGYSGASVRDGAVYVMDREPDRGESMLCLDLLTGKERWRYSYETKQPLAGFDGSRMQPSVDSNMVFAVDALGNVIAVDRASGARAWSLNLLSDFADNSAPHEERRSRPKWGYVQSPVILRDAVVVAPYATNAGLVALDKMTGAIRWRSGGIGHNFFSHVSPQPAVIDGVDQVLTIGLAHRTLPGPAVLSSVDAETGNTLWQTGTRRKYNVPIPQPVQTGSNTVFYTGGYRLGAFVLTVGKTEGGWQVRETASSKSNCTAHVQSPVFFNGRIYAQSFDAYHNTTNNGMVCLEPDLSLRWSSAANGILFDSGPFLIADGMIYVLHGATGELFLLDTDPGSFRVLARWKALEASGGSAWAPMSLSNGRLLARDQTTLKCLLVGPR